MGRTKIKGKKYKMKKITEGQVASEVSVTGIIVLSSDEAIRRSKDGEDVILVKEFTQPEDTIAIEHSVGVITVIGGLTSHASITAREFKKACIINVSEIKIFGSYIIVNDVRYNEGTEVFLDSVTGGIYLKNGG